MPCERRARLPGRTASDDSTRTPCAGAWPPYYGDVTMTEQPEVPDEPTAPARPPESPALSKAEAALAEAEAVGGASPAEQVPLLAAAQAALAELLAEEPVDRPSDD
jgi:hypothetical protein